MAARLNNAVLWKSLKRLLVELGIAGKGLPTFMNGSVFVWLDNHVFLKFLICLHDEFGIAGQDLYCVLRNRVAARLDVVVLAISEALDRRVRNMCLGLCTLAV